MRRVLVASTRFRGPRASLLLRHSASAVCLLPSASKHSFVQAVSFSFSTSSFSSSREFSTSAPPAKLTPGQLVDIAETVLMYMESGIAAGELDKLLAGGEPVTTRLRKMTQIFMSTQLHVVRPFGFEPNEQGLQNFAQAQMEVLKNMDPNSKLVSELREILDKTWLVMLQKTFAIKEIPSLTQDQIRYASSKISSSMQDPKFLAKVKETYEKEMKGLVEQGKMEEAMDMLFALTVPCYMEVLNNLNELEADDNGFVVLQTIINKSFGDPVVAQNMNSGFMAIHSHAPFLPQ